MKNAKENATVLARVGVILFSTLLLARPVRASNLFLEPYVGIGQMVFAKYNSHYNDYEDKDIASGFVLGIKGGYNFTQRYFFALDYQTAGPFKFGRSIDEAEVTMTMVGAGLGLDMDIARYWVGYYPAQNLAEAKSGGILHGDAYKIGFGLKVARNIHANLDLIFNSVYSANGTYTSQVKVQTAFASISLPVPLK